MTPTASSCRHTLEPTVDMVEQRTKEEWHSPDCEQCNLRRRDRRSPFYASDRLIAAFSPDHLRVHYLPTWCIESLPPPSKGVTRWTLCKFHLVGQCRNGHACEYVHVRCLPETTVCVTVHVNCQYQRVEQCEYASPDVTATFKVPVYVSGTTMPVLVPRSHFLMTEAKIEEGAEVLPPFTPSSALRLCHDFHMHNVCLDGPRCPYVHMAHVDPGLGDSDVGRWAPSMEKVVAKWSQCLTGGQGKPRETGNEMVTSMSPRREMATGRSVVPSEGVEQQMVEQEIFSNTAPRPDRTEEH